VYWQHLNQDALNIPVYILFYCFKKEEKKRKKERIHERRFLKNKDLKKLLFVKTRKKKKVPGRC